MTEHPTHNVSDSFFTCYGCGVAVGDPRLAEPCPTPDAVGRSRGSRRPPEAHQTLRAANAARQREWDPSDAITLAYRGNELAGEVGEACNVIKKLERERMGIRGTRATASMLAEELADAVICIDLIAMQAGIDLERAIREKFNMTSEKYGLKTTLAVTRQKS